MKINSSTWIVLIVISEFILLMFPISILDNKLLLVLVAGCLFQMWAFKHYAKTRQIVNRKIVFAMIPWFLAILNLISYQTRKDSIFNHGELKSTKGQIVEIYSQGGGRTTKRHYLKYSYQVDNEKIYHAHEVDFKVWMYYKSNDKNIIIDYYVDNPSISRINNQSLKENPKHDELMKKAMEQLNKERLEKKKKRRED
jgi:hypothetical protein